MSEFKFSCPNCQQNIQATSEYSGQLINCPSCHTQMIVPASPDAPAAAGGKLSMAASTPHPQAAASAAASFYAAKPVRKKKSKTGLIVGLSLGACAIAAAIIFGPSLLKKYKPVQLVQAPPPAETNEPPPPPPQLTTQEILQNVGDAYKSMTDYTAQAKTVCNVDMSAIVPAKTAPVTINTTSSLQLGRTNNYRLEWEQTVSGNVIKGAAWSSGKGNFVGYGPVPPNKVKTRQLALVPAESALLLSGGIADMFFADTNSMAADYKDFTKTNGPSLNGQDCYVLVGEQNHLSWLVWINKSTFLINQVQLTLGGKIDAAELKKLPLDERNLMTTFLKLKGTVTETYDNIRTNQNLLASAFETSFKPSANPAGSSQPSSMAGQLANPRRRGRQPQQ
jgi:hypothetical protein